MKTNSELIGVGVRRLVRRCTSHHFACDCREARFRELLEDTIRAHSTPDNGNYNECDKDPCAWCVEAKGLIEFGLPAKIEPQGDIRNGGWHLTDQGQWIKNGPISPLND